MSEYDPDAIRISKRDHVNASGQWFDDSQFTHKPSDTLYVRHDKCVDYLTEQGFKVTLEKAST
jgi:hypothetical protein